MVKRTKHKSSINIGDTFKTRDNVEITVVEYVSYDEIVVQDDSGNSRRIDGCRLKSGTTYWPFNTNRIIPYKAGQLVKLANGEEITIVEYNHNKSVLVRNSEGIERWTRNECIKRGKISFNKSHYRCSFAKVGDKKVLENGVEVEVVRLCGNSRVDLVDRLGNISNVKLEGYKDGSIAWKHYLEENNRYPIKIGQKIMCVNGIEVTVIGYYDNIPSSLILQDSLGNVETAVRAYRIKKYSWPHKNPRRYYVYKAHIKDKIYYIGQGKAARWKHVNSGLSHSVKLNWHFFTQEEKLTVTIVKDDLSQEEAKRLESSLILEHLPDYNVV